MEESASFGAWLRRQRKARDLTQPEVAHRVGCAVITIQKIEADERRPSKDIAARLADVLALAPEERDGFLAAARGERAVDRLPGPGQPVPRDERAPTAALPRGSVTFLYTDIVGSTQLLRQLGARYAAVLADQRRLLRAAIQAAGGVVVDMQGDRLFGAFGQARQALVAALQAQHALLGHPWPEDLVPRTRMALHTGEPAVTPEGYIGLDVHRVARLCAAAHGGQVLLSQATQALVASALPHHVELRDLGVHRLKDLPHPERLFQVVAADLPAVFPPLTTLDVGAHHLPIPATPLIGRGTELTVVRDLLHQSDVRLVTLTGPGGTGKTRLALEVARQLRDDVPGGIWFVDLAPISDPTSVIPAIAQVLGVRQSGDEPLLASVQLALQDRHLLLVLDNFEQVLDAAGDVAALLATASQLQVLITSREALHLAGEQEVAVPPLHLPDPKHAFALAELTQVEAVALFLTRARAACPDFQITEATAADIRAICARLDGLPLALELAAARCNVLAPPDLLARLDQRFQLLTRGPRTLPARQQTLRATIDWSYNLLTAAEQHLFAQLAVFVGGWTLEVAEAVCAGPSGAVLDGLQSLLDKSLVHQERGQPAAASSGPARVLRFRMLETIREYGLEHLQATGEAATVRRQHAAYFLAQAEAAATALRGPARGAWLNRLEAEHDNLRAALQWALDVQQTELGLRLVTALAPFWLVRGYLSEGYRWWEQAVSLPGAVEPAVRAQALLAATNFWFIRAAAGWIEESLRLFQAIGDEHGVAHALLALDRPEESLAHFRKLHDRHGIADALQWLGLARESEEVLDQALALYRELGDIGATTVALEQIGGMLRDKGDYARARLMFEEGLALAGQIGDTNIYTWILHSWGEMALLQGDYAAAQTRMEASLAGFRAAGNKRGIALELHNLAYVAQHRGAAGQMAASFAESLTLWQEIDSGVGNGVVACLAGFAAAAVHSHASGGTGPTEQGRQGSLRAARLLGAVEALCVAHGLRLWHAWRVEVDSNHVLARTLLDETTWDVAWAEGQAMTLEQAIAFALRETA